MPFPTLPIFTVFKGLSREVWLLSAVSLINRSGSMVVAFLTLYLTQHLQFDIKTAGYVLSFFGIGAIVGAYGGGYLTDKIGYYRVQLLTLCLSGIFLLVMMWVRDFWSFCGIVFLSSVASEGFRPANSVAIRKHSDVLTRTRSLSLMRISVNLAISFALIVGGYLVSIGWHWLFIADGVTCFGAALLLVFFLKENKQTIPPLERNLRHQAPHDSISTAKEAKNEAKTVENDAHESNPTAYQNRRYLLFIFATFVGATVFLQIVWIIPAFFKEIYGWNESTIGWVSAINAFCVVGIEMPLIFRIEKKRSQLWFVRLGIVCYALAHLALILPASQAWLWAVLYMVIISFGEIFVMPFSSNWAMTQGSEAQQGQYMALYTIGYSVANIAAPALSTQIISAFGYTPLWWFSGILCAFAWLLFYFLEKK